MLHIRSTSISTTTPCVSRPRSFASPKYYNTTKYKYHTLPLPIATTKWIVNDKTLARKWKAFGTPSEGYSFQRLQRNYRKGKDPLHEFYSENLIWVNLLKTGYDPDKDVILSMACVVTTKELNIIAEGPQIHIFHPEETLNKLLKAESKSVLEKIFGYTTGRHNHLLAGNSVHTDQKFLEKFMPAFMKKLRYRIVDVSSLKELCLRWYPQDYATKPPKPPGTALDSIKDSIKELQYYRKIMFRTPSVPDVKNRFAGGW